MLNSDFEIMTTDDKSACSSLRTEAQSVWTVIQWYSPWGTPPAVYVSRMIWEKSECSGAVEIKLESFLFDLFKRCSQSLNACFWS